MRSQGRIDSKVTLTLYDAATSNPVRRSERRTVEWADDSWQLFPFASIPESAGKQYRFSIDAEADSESIEMGAAADAGTVDCRLHHSAHLARLFDPWLEQSGQSLPPIPAHLERYLDRHIGECINLKRYFFLRLAHLADAVGRIPELVTDALSIGAGVAYQEAFLAGRFPDMRVVATDFDMPGSTFPMENLRFMRLDLLEPPGPQQYDLVFSIECLEHIEDYRTAFRHKAAMVRPGKYLYVSVPFASRAEQRDPELRRAARDLCGHCTPGFAFEDLADLFAENDLEVLHASNMFHLDVVQPIRRIIERISPAELDCGIGEIAALLLMDLRNLRVESCRTAEGIRFLGRKRHA